MSQAWYTFSFLCQIGSCYVNAFFTSEGEMRNVKIWCMPCNKSSFIYALLKMCSQIPGTHFLMHHITYITNKQQIYFYNFLKLQTIFFSFCSDFQSDKSFRVHQALYTRKWNIWKYHPWGYLQFTCHFRSKYIFCVLWKPRQQPGQPWN